MNNRLKTFICTILCVVTLTTPVLAETSTELQNKADQLVEDANSAKKEAETKQQEINEDKGKLTELQSNMNKMLQEIKSLDEDITKAQGEVNKLQEKLQDLNNQSVTLEADIKKMQEDLEKSKEKMKERLKFLYKNQGNGYIDILFGSSSLSELISRLNFIGRIASHDQAMVDDLKKKENKLNDSLNELQKVKSDVEASKKENEAKTAKLERAKGEKNKLYAQIEGQAEVQQALIAQQESEVNSLMQKIIQKNNEAKQANVDADNKRKEEQNSVITPTPEVTPTGKLFSITGGVRYPITSRYELKRESPISGNIEPHEAIDIGAKEGSGVYALKDGVVIYSGVMTGYGNVVMIDHGDIITLYAHNASLVVQEGENVKGGELISYVGNTGWSTGPHIHFEVRDMNNKKMDPTNYYI
ncbi:murein hydrolase activator EnvC family protein [Clostridium cellulovorans]|uniref:Peptidase M23 n=1 Tax=Clostridium cellulovorans (strain ATCC 35296 / DSM 3052 / OCM 3 / 743B) TaxID=573061 RepID=D9SVS1_CLOC7|nr:M23 family metallopeptidase [Clostridium cellulovorans]ADL53132.1 Peptidase M23 [Clostridium cellulovorans 743B]